MSSEGAVKAIYLYEAAQRRARLSEKPAQPSGVSSQFRVFRQLSCTR